MITPSDITIGVIFTGQRDCHVDQFFRSCIKNSNYEILKSHFLVIDNACTFNLEEKVRDVVKEILQDYDREKENLGEIDFIRNNKIESLSFNHNLIFFNAKTDYIIHANDEVYWRKQWLEKTLKWINKPGNEEKICHLSRCTKGYSRKNVINKMGYFNLLLSGKDGSDSDIEWREMHYLENNSITVEEFQKIGGDIVAAKMVGGFWKQEFFAPLGCVSWISAVVAQPGDVNWKMNDSNTWLQGNENLSERNKNLGKENYWSLIGKQGLSDISYTFKK